MQAAYVEVSKLLIMYGFGAYFFCHRGTKQVFMFLKEFLHNWLMQHCWDTLVWLVEVLNELVQLVEDLDGSKEDFFEEG